LLLALMPDSALSVDTDHAVVRDVVAAVPENFPPHYNIDQTGKPGGFAVEVMNEVAKQADLRVTYKVYPNWPEVFAALRRGEADLIPNIGITAERQLDFQFTVPLESFSIAMFVRDTTDDIEVIEDIKGRAVGALAGNVAIHLLKQKGITDMRIYEHINDALFALLAGEIDVLACPDTVAWRLARRARVDNRIKVVREPLKEIKRAIAVRKGNEALLLRLNTALPVFLHSDAYKSIYVKWHGAPIPFWTPARLSWLFMALLLIAISLMVYWRYRSLIYVNRSLHQSIDERATAEALLRDSEERFRSITAAAQDAIIMINGDGIIAYWNPAAEAILGYTRQDAIGRDIHGLLTPERYREAARKGMRGFAETGTGPVLGKVLEQEALRKDGTEIPVDLSVSSVKVGGQWHAVGIIRDITGRKQAEAVILDRSRELDNANCELEAALQELKGTQARIIQTEKLIALGTLAAGVAHELNNPMMGIMNYVEYADRFAQDPRVKMALVKANRELQRMADIVRNMLTFARPAGKELMQVDVTDIIKRTLQLLAADLRHQNIEVKQDIPESLPPVWARIDGLVQVFLNLLINAVDAMVESDNKMIQIRASAQDETVTVEVEDTGAGIPEYILSRVFDPFFTTKAIGKGTGLGLSVSQNIVNSFGGSLGCRSRAGEGATFTLQLPTRPPAGDASDAEVNETG
jgi:PAS domain S-box-containing protein